jgi:hypothetical protein
MVIGAIVTGTAYLGFETVRTYRTVKKARQKFIDAGLGPGGAAAASSGDASKAGTSSK